MATLGHTVQHDTPAATTMQSLGEPQVLDKSLTAIVALVTPLPDELLDELFPEEELDEDEPLLEVDEAPPGAVPDEQAAPPAERTAITAGTIRESWARTRAIVPPFAGLVSPSASLRSGTTQL